jgi:acyl-CoA synthetase (AMP-forming)/AMP-acid ligase II
MTSSEPAAETTPNYGKRLLVNIVDERARTSPEREWVSIPRTSNPADGWRKITYKQAANAINRVAHRLVSSTGVPPKGEFRTVAYIGPNDVRYLVFALGAAKAGYQALFISPRNSQEGQLNLFELTDCHIIWFEATYVNMVQSWLQERDMYAIMTVSGQEGKKGHHIADRWIISSPSMRGSPRRTSSRTLTTRRSRRPNGIRC